MSERRRMKRKRRRERYAVRDDAERMMGVDLRCGGGRLGLQHATGMLPRALAFDSHRSKEEGPPSRAIPLLLERMMGVEPTLPAWEAEVLPMNYIRV